MRTLQVGDRVMLTQDTMMDRKGTMGRVVEKYVPAHCTGIWSITVQFDDHSWRTSFPYPGAPLAQWSA